MCFGQELDHRQPQRELVCRFVFGSMTGISAEHSHWSDTALRLSSIPAFVVDCRENL
jgi:hypothetical protein